MPLPHENSEWPPIEWRPALAKMREHSAWYSGDTDTLAKTYGQQFSFVSENSPKWKFWSRASKNTTTSVRTHLHVPIAGDLASVSSALLFSEKPEILVEDSTPTQERLNYIIEYSGLVSGLLEASEIASALGGVYLRVSWDRDLFDYPFISVIHPDYVIPEFRWGKLYSVIKSDIVAVDGSIVWRHIENHEPGRIENALYRGTVDRLGVRQSLESRPETAYHTDVVDLPDKMMLVRYIPNMKPNRQWRTGKLSNLGQSDYAGSENMMDSLDEVWSSWIRDVRLARARLVVPEEYLRKRDGGNLEFDLDAEVFTPLEKDPRNDKSIDGYQFAIRSQEHRATTTDLLERIVTHAGYSPQTFGLHIEGRAESGTALRIRERKTFITQQKKASYWGAGLSEELSMLLAIDKQVFNTPGVDPNANVSVKMSDSISHDIGEVAQTVEQLSRAQAISIETKVKMLHPEWDDDRVDEEVAAILRESGSLVPSPDELFGV